MKRFLTVCLLFSAAAFSQRLDPVQWSLGADTSKAAPGASVSLRLTARIDDGWHVYSLTTPKGGPIPTTITLPDNPAIAGFKIYQPKPAREFDNTWGFDTETFTKEIVFWITADLSKTMPAGPLDLTAAVRYQCCDSRQCLPPKKKTATFALTIDPSAPPPGAFVVPAGYSEVKPGQSSPVTSSAAPIAAPQSESWLGYLLTAFGLGLASIFTPCVFPMIPITVSFFLSQRGGIAQAAVFSLGIIVLFSALGLGVSAAVGPFGVVQLAANPWVNGFIALVFGVFALSLLGAFEITLPSSVLTRLDQASRRGGYLGSLLMGLTFSLTSFACVGPFVGSLLAASVQTKGAQPVLGMVTFAAGLAAPFFFLAAFPSYLKKLPKSGGWLARVKVVMGFVLLAAMLKYISTIDQVLQTNWLTRERFLAGWFVLFALAGLYLLGWVRLEGVDREDALGVGRLVAAAVFLIFAFSLLPGMFGSPLGELDAFVPAVAERPGGGSGTEGGLAWMKNQYTEALKKARKENRLVLVDFTGYACTNCKWMKANVFTKPEVAAALKDFVLVELYTDGEDQDSKANQQLQDEKFKTVAVPLFAIEDPDEKVIATSAGLTRDPQQFLSFLRTRPGDGSP